MKKIFFLFFTITLFSGCVFSSKTRTKEENKLFIQVISNSKNIENIIAKSGPIINEIIKQKLSLDQNDTSNFFYPKELQRITVYSLSEFDKSGEQLLFSSLNDIDPISMLPKNIFATANLKFFGEKEDELVLLIDDRKKELKDINTKIKDKLNKLNDQYEKEKKTALYNVKESEKFPYLPHMGLGRISLRLITENIKDKSEEEKEKEIATIINKIKEEIIKQVSELINENLSEKSELEAHKISILKINPSPKKNEYIKEWTK